MAKQTVNIGVTANDNTGDPLRTAFDKLNDNFDEVYAAGPVGTNLQISDNTIASTNTNGNIDINPAGTGTVILNGPTEANGVVTLNSTVTGNIIPTAGDTYYLGSASAPFKELYVSNDSLHIGNLVLKEVGTMLEVFQSDGTTNAILSGNSTTSGSVLNNGNTVVALTTNGPITFYANNYQDGNATTTSITDSLLSAPAVTATGNVTGGNLVTAGDVTTATVTASGNITGGNVSATALTGTLATAAQTNVTSVGTLTTLTVTGNINGSADVIVAGSLTGNSGVINNQLSVGDVVASGNISGAQLLGTDIVATGNVTGNAMVVTSDELTTPNVTFSGDSTAQTTAFKPHVIWRSDNSSAISSTFTNALGNSITLIAGKHYEFMAHILLDNQSTGNISLELAESAGDMAEFSAAMTAGGRNGPVTDTYFFNSTGNISTSMNATQQYHLQIVGTCTPVSNTTLSINVATSTGNVLALTGSSIRAFEYGTDTVGDIV